MDHTDKPVIMWHELTSDDCDIYVKTFDDGVAGGAWVEVGEGSASGFGISGNLGNSHSGWMDLDGDGFPVVAWTITPPGRNNEIYVKRFDGINWVELGAGSASGGGISDNEGVSFDPHIALDSAGNPFVAWYDETGGNDVYMKKFNGTSWVEVGIGSASGGGITNTDSLLTGDYALAVDEEDNPIVAWADDSSGNIEVYVMKHDGSEWVEVGAGSASGGGISSSAGDSTWPSMVIDSTGMPVVAWRDDSSGCREGYVKRFNGDSWEEIGEGSATGGGVSHSGQASTVCIGSHMNWSTISLGVGGGRICVAWNQWSDVQRTTMQVYVRCVDE